MLKFYVPFLLPKFGDQDDWTTGDRTMEMMEEVPRRTSRAPFASLCFVSQKRSGSKGAFRLPGATWDRFGCTVEWNLRPVIVGVDKLTLK